MLSTSWGLLYIGGGGRRTSPSSKEEGRRPRGEEGAPHGPGQTLGGLAAKTLGPHPHIWRMGPRPIYGAAAHFFGLSPPGGPNKVGCPKNELNKYI